MPLLPEDKLINIIRNGKSNRVEFKLKSIPDSIIARHLSSFANTKGGIILFGVRERKSGGPGEVMGLSPRESAEIIHRIERIQKSFPDIDLYVAEQILDGKLIAYAIIEPVSDKQSPISTATGETYQRIVTKDIKINFKSKIKITSDSPKIKAFVAMSFREEEEPSLVDYFKAMERAIKDLKLPIHLNKIDLKEGDYEISQEIMDDIEKTDIVIADFTLSPKNVYFEAGFARGQKKRIIQTAKVGTQLEFDVRHWRTIFYKNATELEEKFKPAIEKAYQEVTSQKK